MCSSCRSRCLGRIGSPCEWPVSNARPTVLIVEVCELSQVAGLGAVGAALEELVELAAHLVAGARRLASDDLLHLVHHRRLQAQRRLGWRLCRRRPHDGVLRRCGWSTDTKASRARKGKWRRMDVQGGCSGGGSFPPPSAPAGRGNDGARGDDAAAASGRRVGSARGRGARRRAAPTDLPRRRSLRHRRVRVEVLVVVGSSVVFVVLVVVLVIVGGLRSARRRHFLIAAAQPEQVAQVPQADVRLQQGQRPEPGPDPGVGQTGLTTRSLRSSESSTASTMVS